MLIIEITNHLYIFVMLLSGCKLLCRRQIKCLYLRAFLLGEGDQRLGGDLLRGRGGLLLRRGDGVLRLRLSGVRLLGDGLRRSRDLDLFLGLRDLERDLDLLKKFLYSYQI